MDRKPAAWTSLIVAVLLSATLCFGPVAWAAEPRAQNTQTRETSADLGIDLLDWLRLAVDAAWSILAGSEEEEPAAEEPPVGEPTVEEPPVAEVGPGMVPIG